MKGFKYIIYIIFVFFIFSCAKDIVDLTGNIKVVVKDYETGLFISNCTVSLLPGGMSGSTDNNGAYTFADVEPGTYTVTFAKSGYVDQTIEAIVNAGKVVSLSVSLLPKSESLGGIKGIVKDYNSGSSISNCLVTLSPGGLSYTTSRDGVFEFSALEPQAYTLVFERSGYEEISQKVSVKVGEVSNLDILLKSKSPFSVSETVYDFGDLQTTKVFDCFNNSGEDCSYSISNVPEWAVVNKFNGTVSAGSNDSFTITVDRDKVDVGEYSQNITVSYSGTSKGSVTVLIKMKKVVLKEAKVETSKTAYDITQNSFNIDGSIVETGGSQIISYGHCWSTSPSPTVKDRKTDLGIKTDIGAFTSTITGLSVGTTYYVRAYATNNQGTSYSEEITVDTQDVQSNKWDGTMAESFAGGSGSIVDPYQIETGAQLVLIKQYPDDNFILKNNIDLNNISWPTFDFWGDIDGNGFSILNLKVTKTDENLGLFGILYGCVKNLTVSGVDIQAGNANNVGAIAGSVVCRNGVSLQNCKVEFKQGSKILGNTNVGGLLGLLSPNNGSDITISECSAVSATSEDVLYGNENVGGLIGYIKLDYRKVVVSECHTSVNIKGGVNIGGVIGCNERDYCSVLKCSYSGTVTGEKKLGGILGSDTGKSLLIEECKADLRVNVSEGRAAGIIGECESSSKIIGSYSNGTIDSGNPNVKYIGGIIGYYDRGQYVYGLNLCYSSVVSDLLNFNGLSGGNEYGYNFIDATDCASIFSQEEYDEENLENCDTSCKDITSFLKSCYSEYSGMYNFNNTWIWKGSINGNQVQVSCPKLSWEK